MQTSLLSLAILFSGALQSVVPPSSATRDFEAAARLERSFTAVCRPADLGPVYELIRRFGGRREPEFRLIVARARTAAAGALRFVSQREQARHWFTSVVRLYANEDSDEFRGIVAWARYNLIRDIADASTRLGRLSELARSLADQSGPGAARVYYDAVQDSAGLLEQRGDLARAAALEQQAREIWAARVEPCLAPMTGEEPICV
jgi:hypothetical protein